jgi:hypothetical protein
MYRIQSEAFAQGYTARVRTMMRFVTNLAVNSAVLLLSVLAPASAQAQQLPNAPRVTCYAKDMFEARLLAAIREPNSKLVTSYSSDMRGNVLLHIQAADHWEMWGLWKMNQAYCLITTGEGRFTEGLPETMTAKVEG